MNKWSQALSCLAQGPHTHTFELWFVKTAMGRYLPMKARVRWVPERYDSAPDGFYESIGLIGRVAEATESELFCRFADANEESDAWAKIMNQHPGEWEVLK